MAKRRDVNVKLDCTYARIVPLITGNVNVLYHTLHTLSHYILLFAPEVLVCLTYSYFHRNSIWTIFIFQECCLHGCDVMHSGKNVPTFRRILCLRDDFIDKREREKERKKESDRNI